MNNVIGAVITVAFMAFVYFTMDVGINHAVDQYTVVRVQSVDAQAQAAMERTMKAAENAVR